MMSFPLHERESYGCHHGSGSSAELLTTMHHTEREILVLHGACRLALHRALGLVEDFTEIAVEAARATLET